MVGAAVGLPIFLLVMLAPMLFLAGLVEVGKSSLWTLSYLELQVQECEEAARVPTPETTNMRAQPMVRTDGPHLGPSSIPCHATEPQRTREAQDFRTSSYLL